MLVTGKAASTVAVNNVCNETPPHECLPAKLLMVWLCIVERMRQQHLLASLLTKLVSGTQGVSQVFQVLVPSVATTVASLSGSSASSTSNLSLTDATTIANILDSAVTGVASSSASSASQVADEAVSGVLNAVSSLTNAFGRRLLQDRRQLLQAANSTSTVCSCFHAHERQIKDVFCVRAAVLAYHCTL